MPQRELERLQTVNRFLKLQISKETELQKIVEQAAALCSAPIAMITFMEDQLQHIRFRVGTDLTQLQYDRSFCQKAIQQDEVFIVADASTDPYFSENPYVKNQPNIRFYAGAPLWTSEGNAIGTVCVYDVEAKKLSAIQQRMLKSMSKQIVHFLEFDASLQLLKEQYIAARNVAITLRSFFESSSSNHILLDQEMCVVAFNQAFDDFTFATQGRRLIPNTLLVDYLHVGFRSDFTAAFNKALEGEKVTLERHLQYQQGRICWYMTFEPAYDRERQIIGVSFNRIDITDRVRHEERVKEQQQALRKIRNLELHELYTPAREIVRLMDEVKNDSELTHLEEIQLLAEAVKELQEKIMI
ncbi:GAF domain-containing protein [Mucilaginibacter sp. PAMB04168]|uniref:GAF domain-containing protein n=1 Tax=Mucilaginibacter sp. PAMB04168 TaxID=3138567 RepID=UPI0031F6AE4F